jgi:hypothetical protein
LRKRVSPIPAITGLRDHRRMTNSSSNCHTSMMLEGKFA